MAASFVLRSLSGLSLTNLVGLYLEVLDLVEGGDQHLLRALQLTQQTSPENNFC